MNVLKIFLAAVVIFLAVPLFAAEETAQPADPLFQQAMKLQKRLALDDAQTLKVREILEREQAAAVKDRDTFNKNALNLIQKAYDRKKETGAQVEVLLNPLQKDKFQEVVKMTRFDRDQFELTEGLVLNEEQVFTVEGILIDYYNKLKEIIPEEMWSDEGPGAGIPMRSPGKAIGASRGFGRMKGLMRSLERKKNRAIRKVLTTGQKVLFEQIQKDRSEKRKRRSEEEQKSGKNNP